MILYQVNFIKAFWLIYVIAIKLSLWLEHYIKKKISFIIISQQAFRYTGRKTVSFRKAIYVAPWYHVESFDRNYTGKRGESLMRLIHWRTIDEGQINQHSG